MQYEKSTIHRFPQWLKMTMLKPGSAKLYPSFWFAAKTFIFLKAPIIFRAEFAFFFLFTVNFLKQEAVQPGVNINLVLYFCLKCLSYVFTPKPAKKGLKERQMTFQTILHFGASNQTVWLFGTNISVSVEYAASCCCLFLARIFLFFPLLATCLLVHGK